MSSTEISGWKDYFSIFPFTQDREDARTGLIASILMNVNRHKKSDRIFVPKDFIPNFLDTPSKPKTIEQQQLEFTSFKGRYLALTGKK